MTFILDCDIDNMAIHQPNNKHYTILKEQPPGISDTTDNWEYDMRMMTKKNTKAKVLYPKIGNSVLNTVWTFGVSIH